MNNVSYKIALIGTGNVAWHLALAFENVGHVITDVYSRKKENATDFSKALYHAEPTDALDFSKSTAEIFIMAVSDDAIESIAQNLQLPPNSILAHTSGAAGLNQLGYSNTENTGVFYPLQTFSKNKKVSIDHVLLCIEGSNNDTSSRITDLAKSITSNVQLIDSKKRKSIHLAAVFACNFANHMFTLSKEIMNHQGLDFELLKPLIAETLNKSLEVGPENAQTGPAKRNDLETLDKQHKALENDPEVAELYRLISQHIIDYYSE
jgi:predicted short-subunit dehydrogenase-like oxidoreductase (DUF2520 family)